MKYRTILIAAALMMIWSTTTQAGAPVKPAANAAKGEEISTQVNGLDSLDLLSGDANSPRGDDEKRSSVESTVFRREKPVEYEPNGRRDPFRALIVDEKKEGDVETDLLLLDGAVLTGVVWAEGHYLALVRDKDGKNFFLREGDPIYQGRVTLVTQSEASFDVSDFGDYQKVVLKVRVKGDEKNKSKDKG
jgi:hypothetical protein